MDTSIIPTVPLYVPTYPEPLYDSATSAAVSGSLATSAASAAEEVSMTPSPAPMTSFIGGLVDVEA